MSSDRTADALLERYLTTRRSTEDLASLLSPEDQQAQSMPDCSPTKWHRAHTTWFFETFVLEPRGVAPYDPRFGYLFNSYYDAVGPRHPRPARGLLTRPTCDEVARWRSVVDERVGELLRALSPPALAELLPVLELGLAHEEQHQELLLTDALHLLAQSPLRPALRPAAPPLTPQSAPPPTRWVRFEGGLEDFGHDAREERFAFDNEGPRHRAWLEPFELASRPLRVAEVLAFHRAGGYRTPALWLSSGWAWAQAAGLDAPGHARVEGDALVLFTVDGEREADPEEPAAFLSWYEADALARWLGARLPTEHEWELAARGQPCDGNFREEGLWRPRAARAEGLAQLYGDVWEWTRSSYEPYPGYAPTAGALGEYNGKFMANQRVLRGGSCFTNGAHLRATYRNFWYPDTRFQVTGARLARDAR